MKPHRLFGTAGLAMLWAFPLGEANAQAVNVNLTVKNETSVACTDGNVTTGVPLAPGTPGSTNFALLLAGVQVPVQSHYLPGIKTPWLLLDFQVTGTLAAGASRTYQLLSQTSTATVPNPLTYSQVGNIITVNTGPLLVTIDRSAFNLFNEVAYDRNGDHVFGPSEYVVTPMGGPQIKVQDAASAIYGANGTPDSVVWEEQGPLRGTLRVQGKYAVGMDVLLFYTTRITFEAGKTHLTVKHQIRNSFQFEERYVKLRSATLSIAGALGGSTVRVGRSGDLVWVNPETGNKIVELIPATLANGAIDHGLCNPPSVSISVDANGGMIIPDQSHHGATVRYDFAEGLSAQQRSDRETLFRNRLVALAPAAWYSDNGAFGMDRFGTYQDEKTAYTNWGWTWPNPNNAYANEHALPRASTNYYPSWLVIKPPCDLEADDLNMHLLMFVRTGLRSYLDRADAWARYMSWEFAHRTDDYMYAWNDWGEWAGTPGYGPVTRTRVDRPNSASFSSSDVNYINLTVKPGKDHSQHTWNGGLIDYYYFSGDPDALVAAGDVAERYQRFTQWRTPGGFPNGSPAGNARFEARAYLCYLRLWEANGSSVMRAKADHMREQFNLSQRYDSRGFYYNNTSELTGDYGTRYPGGKYFSPFIMATVVQAFLREYALTANSLVQSRLQQIAAFALANGGDAAGYTGDNVVVDSGTPGSVQHLSNGVFHNTNPSLIYSFASSSNSFIDALTFAYRLGGGCTYLAKARTLWDRASKGPPNARYATSTQVGHFQNSLEGYYPPERLLYNDNGELTSNSIFFFEAARRTVYGPPSASTLTLTAKKRSIKVTWVAPGTDSTYDLRRSTSVITDANFASATPVPTAAPRPAGTNECVAVTNLLCSSTYYFALKALSSCGSSAISNVPSALPSCGGQTANCLSGFASELPEESAVPTQIELSTTLVPTGEACLVSYGIPRSEAGRGFEIALYDIAGRKVHVVERGVAKAGRFELSWNRMMDGGSMAQSGVYFIRLRVGMEQRVSRVILVR